ncbi:MAG: hypothetical protein JW940_31420 [Polyangiaceae bacterium]|nr:hypothetical protein [Polyangiaceae bacterium]
MLTDRPLDHARGALPAELRAALFSGEAALPESVERQVVELGEAAVPGLLEVATDLELAEMDAPGQGLAPAHAVKLLGEIGAAAAAAPLIDVLERLDDDDFLYNEVCLALPRFGAALLEPALAALAASPNEAPRDALCFALAESGIQDERVFEHLTQLFAESTQAGACALSVYGDPRALPLLEEQLRSLDVGEKPAITRSTLAELTGAYARIAGSLPDELKEHTASLRTQIEAAIASAALDRAAHGGPGAALVRRLENAPGRPWVCASTCTDPDCECREATLFFAAEREALNPLVALVAAGGQEKELWEHARLHPTGGVTLAVIGIDEGDVGSLIDDTGAVLEVDETSDNVAMTRATSWVDGELLDALSAHWCRAKGLDPDATAQLEGFSWRRGEELPWTDVFNRSRIDVYALDDGLYELVEHYCPLPDCDCNGVVLEWIELGKKERVVSTIEHTIGSPLPTGGGDALLTRLWARFSQRYPDHEQHWSERRKRMQAFCARLLAYRAAHRPEKSAAKWVSTSQKGSKGKQSRKGKKRK